MNLMMRDKFDKNAKIYVIENKIRKLREYVSQLEKEIKDLEEEHSKLQVSSLPILLFMIDETLPMPDNEDDYIYEYIYYCPDLGDLKYIVTNRNDELLPNAIDLRENFQEFGVPKKIFPGKAYNYQKQINDAVAVLNSESANFIINHPDSSWQDLGLYLVNNLYNEDVVKVLKPRNK